MILINVEIFGNSTKYITSHPIEYETFTSPYVSQVFKFFQNTSFFHELIVPDTPRINISYTSVQVFE